MREWNRIKVEDGPGADWQGEREGRGGVGEGGADGAGEQNARMVAILIICQQ